MRRAKETLVWAHAYRSRWEFARAVANIVTGKQQWERRDGSYICDVGSELATMAAPPKPSKAALDEL